MTTIIFAIVSAILYRVGGAGKEEIPWANSQYRDIGCPVIVLLWLIMAGFTWYLALASAVLVLLFIRTYHDYTGSDNMYLHGLCIGFSMLPLVFDGVAWFPITLYGFTLMFVMGLLNTFCTRVKVPNSVWIEELTRGAAIILALPLLLVWLR